MFGAPSCFRASDDVRMRYKRAFLGLAWAILQPSTGAVVLTLVFHRLSVEPIGASALTFRLNGSSQGRPGVLEWSLRWTTDFRPARSAAQ